MKAIGVLLWVRYLGQQCSFWENEVKYSSRNSWNKSYSPADSVVVCQALPVRDDMTVGHGYCDRHDELVEEILRRLKEHDLYVKPEKYEWKVWEVGFLGVVIGPDGIKMKKEKVRGMLE